MIQERDLQQAIAECLGERNPNANTCIKLAAFYTIKDHLYPSDAAARSLPGERYSYADSPVSIDSGTEFAKIIRNKEPEKVLGLMDELMSALQTMVPRLYESVMRRLQE